MEAQLFPTAMVGVRPGEQRMNMCTGIAVIKFSAVHDSGAIMPESNNLLPRW